MMSRRRGSALAWALGLAALGGGCSPGATVVAVSVSGVPAGTQTLRVSATLDGAPLVGIDEVPAAQPFGVRLPVGAGGEVKIAVQALALDTCAAASGGGAVTASGQARIDLAVALVPAVPHLCRVTVTLAGAGQGVVTTADGQIQCGARCAADVPVGQVLTLRAEPAAASVFQGWTGLCEGGGEGCAVTVQGPQRVAATFGTSRRCSARGFCWEHPLPYGLSLRGASARSAQDVWAVSEQGDFLHHDGRAWQVVDGPVGTPALNAVWGAAADAAWAVGEAGALLRWDGRAWRAETGLPPELGSAALYAVTGTGAADVWAVGAGGLALHRTAAGWSAVRTGVTVALRGVWAGAAVYAVGDQGTVLALAGDGALQQDSKDPALAGQTPDLRAVWGAAGEAFAVGAGGAIWHRDGARWSAQSSGVTDALEAVWGSGPRDVWAVGVSGGRRLHHDGAAWTLSGATDYNLRLHAVAGAGAADVWLVGGAAAVLRLTASGEFQRQVPVASASFLRALWGRTVSSGLPGAAAQDEVFAVGFGGAVLRRGAAAWGAEGVPAAAASRNLNGVGGTATGVWAVGAGGLILARAGNGAWATEDGKITQDLYGVAARADEVYAVGDGGTVLRRAPGGAWASETSGSAAGLRGVWVQPSDGAVWAVGQGGAVLRRAPGGGWTGESIDGGAAPDLRAVWSSGGTLWATGGGAVLRRDAGRGAWAAVLSQPGWDLSDGCGDGAGGVWVLGSYHMVHLDSGGAVREQLDYRDRGPEGYLGTVWPGASGLYVAGEGGAILYRSGVAGGK